MTNVTELSNAEVRTVLYYAHIGLEFCRSNTNHWRYVRGKDYYRTYNRLRNIKLKSLGLEPKEYVREIYDI